MLHEIEFDFTHPGMHLLAAIAVIIIIYMLYMSTLKRAMGKTFNSNSAGLNKPNIVQGPAGTLRGPLPLAGGSTYTDGNVVPWGAGTGVYA